MSTVSCRSLPRSVRISHELESCHQHAHSTHPTGNQVKLEEFSNFSHNFHLRSPEAYSDISGDLYDHNSLSDRNHEIMQSFSHEHRDSKKHMIDSEDSLSYGTEYDELHRKFTVEAYSSTQSNISALSSCPSSTAPNNESSPLLSDHLQYDTRYQLADNTEAVEIECLERIYGGQLRAQHAARRIQSFYRNYRLRKEYSRLVSTKSLNLCLESVEFCLNDSSRDVTKPAARTLNASDSLEDLLLEQAYVDWALQAANVDASCAISSNSDSFDAGSEEQGSCELKVEKPSEKGLTGSHAPELNHSNTNTSCDSQSNLPCSTSPPCFIQNTERTRNSSVTPANSNIQGTVCRCMNRTSAGNRSMELHRRHSSPLGKISSPTPIRKNNQPIPDASTHQLTDHSSRSRSCACQPAVHKSRPIVHNEQMAILTPMQTKYVRAPSACANNKIMHTQNTALFISHHTTPDNHHRITALVDPSSRTPIQLARKHPPHCHLSSIGHTPLKIYPQQRILIPVQSRASPKSCSPFESVAWINSKSLRWTCPRSAATALHLQHLPPHPPQKVCSSSPYASNQRHLAPSNLINKQARLLDKKRKRVYRIGLNIFNKTPTKGIEFLIKYNFITTSPDIIAQFLLTRKGLSRVAIGEYLGNTKDEKAKATTREFMRHMDFRGLELDEALRLLLSCFRTPGESQKIAHLLTEFQAAYVHQNNKLVKTRYRQLDSVMVLAYAIIMLHTDMYSPNVRCRSKMTREEFIRNLRGIDAGEDLDRDRLIAIYERIQSREMKVSPDHTDQVRNIQKHLTGPLRPINLSVPERRLVCYCRLFEVPDKNKKSRLDAHQREVFLFNDHLLITKAVRKKRWDSSSSYQVRLSVDLLGLQVLEFDAPYYPHGLELVMPILGQNCHSTSPTMPYKGHVLATLHTKTAYDRARFIEDLRECVLEVDEMDKFRRDEEVTKVMKQRQRTDASTGEEFTLLSPHSTPASTKLANQSTHSNNCTPHIFISPASLRNRVCWSGQHGYRTCPKLSSTIAVTVSPTISPAAFAYSMNSASRSTAKTNLPEGKSAELGSCTDAHA